MTDFFVEAMQNLTEEDIDLLYEKMTKERIIDQFADILFDIINKSDKGEE